VTCNAMRRRRLGQRDGLPGDCALAPASRRRAPASPLLSRCAIPPGVDTHKGRSWWGGRRCVTRHLLRWRWARIRAATSFASAQLQHPRHVEPPSRRPIRPKRAAISRLLAQNLKRGIARLENREIARVFERGAGLTTIHCGVLDENSVSRYRCAVGRTTSVAHALSAEVPAQASRNMVLRTRGPSTSLPSCRWQTSHACLERAADVLNVVKGSQARGRRRHG
jgi:hypothetical protein